MPKTFFRLLALFALASSACAAEKDPFQELVRPTDPLTPDGERAAFHLPPGFEMQLVASEPDLRKPMNMQWDVLGRLWITESREYPFPIKDGSTPRDTVRIFSDFGPDGRARKVEIFADGLNIPTGLYPFRTANAEGKLTWKCLVWSIPNIWLMEDTDGDGKADKRQVLYGPLGWERDTHGNISSFRRGQDGWLYGTHGFNNQSTIRGTDGSELTIQSGNTYRIRLDGSRVEGYTFGQVNPFGLCWDPRGNLYSADCHSSPIYQLLRGAYYPSFGKPHDGMGFGPQTITHSHGSTAICAPIYVSDPAWPAELQNHMFVGNVQTSRLNQDAIVWHGSSSKGTELPDFLSTDDPWFRPVDLSWGPDGALYVADFYNKIIGHYEVPLTHPGRDRERGRLWRIVYQGAPGSAPAPALALPQDIPGLVQELGSGNLTRRTLALQELCDVSGAAAVPALQAALAKPVNGWQKVQALWALQRLGGVPDEVVVAAMHDADPVVRTHALRLGRERLSPTSAPALAAAAGDKQAHPLLLSAAREALHDPDALVQRGAVELLGARPASEHVPLLLAALHATPQEDDHLLHVIRMALRDQLRAPGVAAGLSLQTLRAGDLQTLLEVLSAVPGPESAQTRLAWMEEANVAPAVFNAQLASLAKDLPAERLNELIGVLRQKVTGDVETSAGALLKTMAALEQRRLPAPAPLQKWGGELLQTLLAAPARPAAWTSMAGEGGPANPNSTTAAISPWTLQERPCADNMRAQLLSSLPKGEEGTGIVRSAPLTLPVQLSFYLAGHDGFPEQPPGKKNMVRLRDAATGEVLREATPPRNDMAQKVVWNLEKEQGRRAYVELIDGDNAKAFAWLAAGRFEPELPELAIGEPATAGHAQMLAADLARSLRLGEAKAPLATLLTQAEGEADVRVAAARALLVLDPAQIKSVAQLVMETGTVLPLREKLARALGEVKSRASEAALVAALPSAPHRLQAVLAEALANTREGAEVLVAACVEGKAAATLLREKALASRLKALNDPALSKQLDEITAHLPPANAELDKLIAARSAAFSAAHPDAARGADVFTRNCAVCHAVEGKGGNVGPQLDGVGGRGADRLLEDILDPSRNVDRAFRIVAVTKKDGSVASGLFRREEGAQLVLADLAAQEIRIDKGDISSRQETEASLMPPVFGESIPPGELSDLIAYLLTKKSGK